MAYDLKDLGSNTSLLDFSPNWVSDITFRLEVVRYYARFPGGYPYMKQMSEFVPAQWSAQYTMESKEEENEFLLYLSERAGNARRFWAVYPRNIFTMKSSWSSTDIVCEPNDFHLLHKGQERIFVLLKDGDLLTRRVSSATHEVIGDNLTLVVANAPAAQIEPSDVAIFGRIYLVRFDMARFIAGYNTDDKSSFRLDFIELNEYGDTDL